MVKRQSSTRGFKRTSSLLSGQIRKVGESRGFAVSRLLTHWDEVAGPDMAAKARPVNVSYGRGGLGATLTLLTTGALAPMVEMSKEKLRERVNAAYGYNAIARIRITQTAATGFAEAQAHFAQGPANKSADLRTSEPPSQPMAEGVKSEALREALEKLGQNVVTRQKQP